MKDIFVHRYYKQPLGRALALHTKGKSLILDTTYYMYTVKMCTFCNSCGMHKIIQMMM